LGEGPAEEARRSLSDRRGARERAQALRERRAGHGQHLGRRTHVSPEPEAGGERARHGAEHAVARGRGGFVPPRGRGASSRRHEPAGPMSDHDSTKPSRPSTASHSSLELDESQRQRGARPAAAAPGLRSSSAPSAASPSDASPSGTELSGEGAAAEGSAAEGPAAEGSAADDSGAHGSAAEGSAADDSGAHGSAADGSAADGSAADDWGAELSGRERSSFEPPGGMPPGGVPSERAAPSGVEGGSFVGAAPSSTRAASWNTAPSEAMGWGSEPPGAAPPSDAAWSGAAQHESGLGAAPSSIAPVGRPPRDPLASGLPPEKPPTRRWAKVLRWCLFSGLVLGVVGVLAVVITVWRFSRDLPSVAELESGYAPPQVTRILARDGTLLANLFTERRTVVPFERVPSHVKHAFLAAEDAHFYQHEGLNYLGMVRALWVNLRAGKVSQ